MRTILAILLVAAPAAAQDKKDEKRAAVDVVFCVDCSGSMGGVIQTAKEKIWTIVGEIAKAKPTPVLRIGIIGYGDADRRFRFFELTDDLDAAYGNLLTFKADIGGDEWVGLAVRKAAEEMKWNTSKEALRLIFVVGNETARQGPAEHDYAKTVPLAIARDIMVNTIFCGEGVDETWREIAKLGDGASTVIAAQGGAVAIETPMDKELIDLNAKLNGTYLPYGRKGAEGQKQQVLQDSNSHSNGGASNLADRAGAKAWSGYNCRGWDLVDAAKEKEFKLESVKDEELPEEMRKMTMDERRAHIEKKRAERDAIVKQVQETGVKRAKFIQEEMKKRNLNQDSAFDEAVRRVIREQAAKRGYAFEGK